MCELAERAKILVAEAVENNLDNQAWYRWTHTRVALA